MRAPEVDVVLHTGERIELSTLYHEKPLILVFLRHFG